MTSVIVVLAVALMSFSASSSAFGQGAPADIYYNSFEFPDMRFCARQSDGLCINQNGQNGTLVIGAGEQVPGPANGGVGRGTLGSGVLTGFTGWGNGTDLRIVNEPANCHNGSQWCGRADVSAGAFPASLYFESGYWRMPTAPNQQTQGCSGFHSGCATGNRFYRTNLRFASNYQLAPGNPNNNSCNGKLLYLRDSNATGADTTVIGFRYFTGDGQAFRINFETMLNGVYSHIDMFFFTPDNQWHSLEVNYNPLGEFMQIWWDDVSKFAGHIGPMPTPTQIVDYNTWGEYINQNQGATEDRCVAVTTSTVWVDDMAVSTQQIGAGSGATDTTPPTIQITGPTSNPTFLTRVTPLEMLLWLALGFGLGLHGYLKLWNLRKKVKVDRERLPRPDHETLPRR